MSNLHFTVIWFFNSCYKEYFYDASAKTSIKRYIFGNFLFKTTGLISDIGQTHVCNLLGTLKLIYKLELLLIHIHMHNRLVHNYSLTNRWQSFSKHAEPY